MSGFNPSSSRREFLIGSSAFAATTLLPASLVAQDVQSAATTNPTVQIPNRDTQLKFNLDGSRRPFAGNTVICHLPVQCAVRDAMIELHDAMASSSFRQKLGLTSVDSYHMTIFAGANDQDRMVTGWPSYVPKNAPIEVCNQMVGERMAKARLSCGLPLRVRVDQQSTLNFSTACSLRMMPADSTENRKMRSIRDQLGEVYGFRSVGHSTYGFHITMSYQVAPFTNEERSTYAEMLKTHVKRIVDAEPTLELGNPEYCIFPDMFRFDPKKLIACS